MRCLLASVLCAVAACVAVSCGGQSNSVDDFNSRPITLPNGQVIHAEVMVQKQDMYRGMMFRDSLAPGQGMLFVHAQPSKVPYWMYQVRIPLDIIWMDANRRVVEISANTPPCPSKSAKECPTFGGHYPAQWVLELGGGMAAKYGLAVGDVLSFY